VHSCHKAAIVPPSTQHSFSFQSDYHQQIAQQHKLCITRLLTTVIDLLQEKYQVQEQQATSAQSNLASLQSAYSTLKAQHDSALAAQAAAEQRLAASSSELTALQTRHATQQAELSSISAERDRLTQAGTIHTAELSQMQRDLSTSQVQLDNSREQHKQVQEKLTAHEAGLTQLQQQHYQTGDSARGQTHATS